MSTRNGTVTLLLGGARSGKSRHALDLVRATGLRAVFVATATAMDDDMAARIARHRRDRGAGWELVEEPLELAAVVDRYGRPSCALLIDCLTLWLSQLLQADRDVDREVDRLVGALAGSPAEIVVVSNELGMGVHPETALGRRFRDLHGRMNQRVAAAADRVVLLVAGLPLLVKG